MTTSRWLIRSGVFACALGVGLVAGRALMTDDSADPPGEAQQRLDGVVVTAPVTVTDSAVGMPLIATRRLATEAPPAHVRDCRTFFSWAYAAGAATTLPVTHTLSIRAHRTARVVLDRIYAQQLPAPTDTSGPGPTGQEQLVRLQCATDAGSHWTDPEEEHDLRPVAVIQAGAPVPDESFYQEHVFDLTAGGEAVLSVPVEPLRGTGRYEYVLRGVILVDGKPQDFVADAGGRPFRWSEDLGGMGYSPATHIWTLRPTPKLTRCPEIRQSRVPEPAPSCTAD